MCRTADCNCSQISAHATLQRCSRGRRCCKLDPRWDSNIRPTYLRAYLSTCRAWPAHLVINIRSIELDTDLQTLCSTTILRRPFGRHSTVFIYALFTRLYAIPLDPINSSYHSFSVSTLVYFTFGERLEGCRIGRV